MRALPGRAPDRAGRRDDRGDRPGVWRRPVRPEAAEQTAAMMVAAVESGSPRRRLPGVHHRRQDRHRRDRRRRSPRLVHRFRRRPESRATRSRSSSRPAAAAAGALPLGRDLLVAAMAAERAAVVPSTTPIEGSEEDPAHLLYVRALSNQAALPETSENARISHARSGGWAGRTVPAGGASSGSSPERWTNCPRRFWRCSTTSTSSSRMSRRPSSSPPTRARRG